MAPTAQHKQAAEALKNEGNSLFKQGKWGPAIDRYTEAITMDPTLAVLYVNRAMAQKKRGAWSAVYEDSRQALKLDSDLMKAHYLLGLASREQQDLGTACHHLQKALEAAREKNDGIKDEIWHELAIAKYEQWASQAKERQEEQAALRQQLADMLSQSQRPLRCDGAEANGGGAEGGHHAAADAPQPIHSNDPNLDNGTRHGMGEGPSSTSALTPAPLARGTVEPPLPPAWQRLFTAAGRPDVPAEAPSLFTCSLTMEVFREPMLSPSGHSYERSALLEHLTKVGQFDPITRQPISEGQCIPNLGLRAAIQLYLDEHPWAWREAGAM